ncbi:MAG TPA: DUF2203 domain-containing protein [bacterium]|nr:DUF2203 domain-containing protein [bacterium]
MRYFTLPEAQALLPRLREVLEALRRTRDAATLKKTQIDLLWKRLEGGEAVLGTIGDEQKQMDSLASRLTAIAEDVEKIGCVLRDVDAGLVDFPARVRGGRTVFLCWRLGEPEIAFWHGTNEGFTGRKPLADLPLDQA